MGNCKTVKEMVPGAGARGLGAELDKRIILRRGYAERHIF